MKLKCENCGHDIDLDKTEKDLRIISDQPKLGEVFVTCCHCDHEQRIEIAARGLAFRKGAFRKIYEHCLSNTARKNIDFAIDELSREQHTEIGRK